MLSPSYLFKISSTNQHFYPSLISSNSFPNSLVLFSSISISNTPRSCLVAELFTARKRNNLSMEGSIANELYLGILQPTNFEQDKNVVVTQTDDKLHETDPGDSWYDDGSSSEGHVEASQTISDMDREWQKRHDQFHTIGYRDGLIAGKEFAAQEGFNIGFKDSVSTGYNWGLVRGVASAMACLPGGLKEKLVEIEDTRNKFQLLHGSVQAISTTDALKLFYEDHKRKSAEQNDGAEASSTSADLKHQNDGSIFNNYSGQLRSILNDSPLVGVHLEISK